MGKVPKLGRAGYRWMLLAVLVAGAGALRFYHIDEPGFTEGADCMYTETAYTMLLLGQWSWHNPGLLFAGVEKTQGLVQYFSAHHVVPQMPYSCKPVWDFMSVAAVAVGGYADVVLAGLSALMGTLTVLAIFVLGRALYGIRVGYCAAALLSVTGGALVFSRYGQSHMASLFLLVVGFWLYVRSLSQPMSWRPVARSSLFLGLALATHPNLLPNVALFPAYELLLLSRQGMTWPTFLRRAMAIAGTLVAVVLLLDLPFEVMRLLFGDFFSAMAPRMYWPFMTYLEQLPHHFGLVVTDVAPGLQDRLYTYLVEPWAWEGAAVVALVAVSSALWLRRLRRSSFEDLMLHTQVLLPLLFWVCSENQAVYRFAAGILPAGMLLAARQLERLAQSVSQKRGWSANLVTALATALAVAYTFHNSRVIYQARSAYKETAHWLLHRGEDRIMTSHPRSWRFYGVTVEPLSADRLGAVRYMVFYPRYLSDRERAVLSALAGQEPVTSVLDLRPGKLLEVQFASGSLVLELLLHVPGVSRYAAEVRDTVLERNRRRRLDVYDIGQVRGQLAALL